jgi:Ca2+-binding EF-hand superfamily protein
MGIQGIIRDYFEKLCSSKFENLEEIYSFLDTYKHSKLNQEDINHLNRSITQNDLEAAIKRVCQKSKVRT